jgi:cytosine/adenosine deaminase-related metal-dependent hydrolase
MTRTLLHGAQVITMTPGRPDAESVDVLITGHRITEIGVDLVADDADTVDLSGRILIPGLVNAHLHTWQTALRGVSSDWTLMQYLMRMHGVAAETFCSEDIHVATLAGALNQINCGTTTLGDWCHNNPTPRHTDAAIDALGRSGIRAVFFHGAPKQAPDVAHPVAEVDRLLEGPAGKAGLLTVGMAVNGPQGSTPEVAIADFQAAAKRGLVISMHQSGGEPGPAWEAVRRAGLFGAQTNIVHGAGLDDEWIRVLAEDGVSFTVTPENELGQGHPGAPITGPLLRAGTAPSLGTDSDCIVGSELLTAARVALAHQRGLDHERHRQATGTLSSEPSITAKQALSWATVEGARALNLADRIGRLEPGMHADLVAIDARALNLWPAHDPVATALHADIGNIEAVMIAGQWRKRDHVLLEVDLEGIKTRLLDSGERLLAQIEQRS